MAVVSARSTELADEGGHFFRADFQVHTPRDTQWTRVRPTDEAGRKAWAESFVAAARDKGLHAVAISDHHDFTYFPYIKEAAEHETAADGTPIPERERLVVFPALELTLSVPCQAILILDADFPVDRLDDVLKALLFEPVDPSLPVLPQTVPLQNSGDINDIIDRLNQHGLLRNRFILLPNVTPCGHKTLLRTSFHDKYKMMRTVGGYLDGPISQLDQPKYAGEKNILAGGDKLWGHKRLAVFQTSDARTDDFAHLGEHSTWVKWVSPTAEALRQACLAQESRISQELPALPNVRISRVVVSQSKFMSHVDVALNPQYTALIGGRGTGKSTILDYIRWTLCDQPAQATDDDEVADPRVRQRKLVEATLKPFDAHVEVHSIINGIAHVVRRSAADGTVQLKVGDGPFEKVRESAIQSLLPVQAYSQKQLSSVAIRLDELLRFVTSPIQRKLEDIDRRIGEISDRLRENYGTLQRFRGLQSEVDREALREHSIGEQAKALRAGLAGLSDDDRMTLGMKPAYDAITAAEAGWLQQVEMVEASASDAVARIETALARLAAPDNLPEAAAGEATALLAGVTTLLEQARDAEAALRDLVANALCSGGSVGGPRGLLDSKVVAYHDVYAAVKERSSAHQVQLGQLAELEARQKEASELVRRLRKELEALGQPQEKHVQLRAELVAARRERSEALSAQCGDLVVSSDGLIKATLSPRGGFAGIQQRFKSLIAGSNVRSAQTERFFEAITASADPVSLWETVLEELEGLMLLEPDAEINPEVAPTVSQFGLAVTDQKRLAPRLTPDGWLDLSLTGVVDYPEFEYRAKEGDYIPFAAASAGQQASALLTTLLSQNGMPLLVDQPEEDLDSETVQLIVEKIWAAKSRRQLIFASHNANLVVNGDADLVLVCSYVKAGDQSAGHIKCQGAIDVEGVRNQITKVMEGGEKAFKLRKEKYGF